MPSQRSIVDSLLLPQVLPYLADFDGDATWLMFSDDDDVWHPRRVESYAASVRGASASVTSMHSPVCAVNSSPLEAGSGRGGGVLAASVRSDQLIVRKSDATEGADNYWSILTRLWQWRGYFEATPAEELKSIYSDIHYCLFTFPSMKRGATTRPECLVEPLGGAVNWMYLWRQDHGGNPQHTEQQKSRLRPIVVEGLERFFGRAAIRKRFYADMAHAMGVSEERVTGSVTVDSMVGGFADEATRAEGFLELCRVSLRSGAMTLDQVLQSEARASDAALANDQLRATLFPGAAPAPSHQEVGGADEVSERISAGTNSVVSAYKSARLEQMAERGFSYARLDVAAVTDAFAGCMAKRRFF